MVLLGQRFGRGLVGVHVHQDRGLRKAVHHFGRQDITVQFFARPSPVRSTSRTRALFWPLAACEKPGPANPETKGFSPAKSCGYQDQQEHEELSHGHLLGRIINVRTERHPANAPSGARAASAIRIPPRPNRKEVYQIAAVLARHFPRDGQPQAGPAWLLAEERREDMLPGFS